MNVKYSNGEETRDETEAARILVKNKESFCAFFSYFSESPFTETTGHWIGNGFTGESQWNPSVSIFIAPTCNLRVNISHSKVYRWIFHFFVARPMATLQARWLIA